MTCLTCPHHEVIADPDPHDWFCSDDEAVVCQLTPNSNKDVTSIYAVRRHDSRAVASACRPYNKTKEA